MAPLNLLTLIPRHPSIPDPLPRPSNNSPSSTFPAPSATTRTPETPERCNTSCIVSISVVVPMTLILVGFFIWFYARREKSRAVQEITTSLQRECGVEAQGVEVQGARDSTESDMSDLKGQVEKKDGKGWRFWGNN